MTNTMSDRIEEKFRDLLLAEPGCDDLKAIYRGDPYIVPSRLHPFAMVACVSERAADGERGYGNETGPVTYWVYEGAIALEVLARDSKDLAPDDTRRADVPSYKETRRLMDAARRSVLAWAGKDGMIPEGSRVVSADGKETTLLLIVGRVDYGLAVQSRSDNVTNIGTFDWRVFSRREDL